MAAKSQTPQPFQSGPRLIDGTDLDNALANSLASTTQSAVASGTTKATGTQITTRWTNFTTVAAGGIAILPPAVPGAECVVFNNGAQTLTFNPYEASGTTIDGAATATLSTANRACSLRCLDTGVWISALLGATTS